MSAALSIVVAAWNGPETIRRCLAGIGTGGEEIIVATTAARDDVRMLKEAHPGVTFVRAPPGTSVFLLRALGVVRATEKVVEPGASVVALLEDHVTVAPSWRDALMRAHDAGHRAVAGPVACAGERGYPLALHLVEYGNLPPTAPRGPVPAASAVNASYDRDALDSCFTTWQVGFYDNEVSDQLRANGQTIQLEPEALVTSHLHMTPRAALVHLARGGRRFGSYRAFHAGAARWLWLLASPAVPAVLLARLLRRSGSTMARGALLGATPWIALLLLAWATGEATGYLMPASLGREETMPEVEIT